MNKLSGDIRRSTAYTKRAIMTGEYQEFNKEALEECVKRLICDCIKRMTIPELETLAHITVAEDVVRDGEPCVCIEVAIRPSIERVYLEPFKSKQRRMPDTAQRHDDWSEADKNNPFV